MLPTALFAFVLSVDPIPRVLRDVDGFSAQAASYATAAHLPALADMKQGSEVRVWKFDKRSKDVTGWILSPTKVRIYSGQDDMRLRATVWPKEGPTLFQTFAKVSAIRGSVCPLMLSPMLLIEGVEGGTYFVHYAGKPSACKRPLSQEISAAYIRLTKLAPD